MDVNTARYKLQVAKTLLRDRHAAHRRGPTRRCAHWRHCIAGVRPPRRRTQAAAIRYPERLAIVDERGTLTFGEVHRRTNALARELAAAGVKEGDGVAIMCRNHRGFIETTVACSKLGASALYLNTAFAGPQITDVLARERPAAVVYDLEFADLVREGAAAHKRFIGWSEPGEVPCDPQIEELIARGEDSDLAPPIEPGRVVILTSGTTGTPKGATRKQPDSLEPVAALFSAIPLRARETTMIAAPMFHSWGFAHFTLGAAARLDARAEPQVRPRGDAAGDGPEPRHRARGGAGDAPADHGSSAGDDCALRPQLPPGDRAQRIGAAGGTGHTRDGCLRRCPLQPLRLDRGGLGHDRLACGPACGAGHRRSPSAWAPW